MRFHTVVLAELLQKRPTPRSGRPNPRGVKRKMSDYPIRPKAQSPSSRIDIAIYIIK
ncbi:hypothetical protein JRX38_11455 [Gluconobacter cerinus]|uniref:hypothetical protein n=1 Tax=Gluconobacter cerinus TaxID=38307 RepID=UPI00193FE85F|nr:hypothetical protein [Gluconobacter cerinus]MBM3098615.1 hypothetical protein [Gluconobacter cerinus]